MNVDSPERQKRKRSGVEPSPRTKVKQSPVQLYPSPTPTWGQVTEEKRPVFDIEETKKTCRINWSTFKEIVETLKEIQNGKCFNYTKYEGGTAHFVPILFWHFLRYNLFPNFRLPDFYFNNIPQHLVPYSDFENEIQVDQFIFENKELKTKFSYFKDTYKFDKMAVVQFGARNLEGGAHAFILIINPFKQRYVLMDSAGIRREKRHPYKILTYYFQKMFASIGFPEWKFDYYPRVNLQYELSSCSSWATWLGVVYLLGKHRECFYRTDEQLKRVDQFSRNIATAVLHCFERFKYMGLEDEKDLSVLCQTFSGCDAYPYASLEIFLNDICDTQRETHEKARATLKKNRKIRNFRKMLYNTVNLDTALNFEEIFFNLERYPYLWEYIGDVHRFTIIMNWLIDGQDKNVITELLNKHPEYCVNISEELNLDSLEPISCSKLLELLDYVVFRTKERKKLFKLPRTEEAKNARNELYELLSKSVSRRIFCKNVRKILALLRKFPGLWFHVDHQYVFRLAAIIKGYDHCLGDRYEYSENSAKMTDFDILADLFYFFPRFKTYWSDMISFPQDDNINTVNLVDYLNRISENNRYFISQYVRDFEKQIK